MKIPKGIEVQSHTEWVLKENKNIYRQRQADTVWNKLIVEKLTNSAVAVRKSNIDECVFYLGKIMNILYTNDYDLKIPEQEELRQSVSDTNATGLNIT